MQGRARRKDETESTDIGDWEWRAAMLVKPLYVSRKGFIGSGRGEVEGSRLARRSRGIVSMGFSLPLGREHHRPNRGDDQQAGEPGVPAFIFHQRAEAPAGKDCAQVTEKAGETHGSGRGAFGGEVGRGDAHQAL